MRWRRACGERRRGGLAPRLAIVLTITLTLTAASGPARASDGWAAAGLGIGSVLLLAVAGGVVTTALIAPDVVDGRSVAPALRNVGIVCASINVAAGAAGLIITPLAAEDDYAPVLYGVSGGVLALGLVGGGFALAAEPWSEGPSEAPAREGLYLAPTMAGFTAGWAGRF